MHLQILYIMNMLRKMEHNINLVVKLYSDIPDEQLQSIIKNKIGKYDMEFNYE